MRLLLHHDYDSLPFRDRVVALRWLSDQVLEGPSVRAELEERDREAHHMRKQLWEEAKVRVWKARGGAGVGMGAGGVRVRWVGGGNRVGGSRSSCGGRQGPEGWKGGGRRGNGRSRCR